MTVMSQAMRIVAALPAAHPPGCATMLDRLWLTELHRRVPQASQMACAVALGRRLPCAGSVVLTDRRTHLVVFAYTAGDHAVRPRRDVPVPDTHQLRRVTPESPRTVESFWAEPWGARRNLYLDVIRRASAAPTRSCW